MDKVEVYTNEFKSNFKESKYHYSDEFLYGLISELREEVDTLKKRLESDGK